MRYVLAVLALSTFPAVAEDRAVIYLDPSSPSTSMFRIEGWPSFLFMPGAPISVSYRNQPSVLGPAGGAALTSSFALNGDIDCDSVAMPVYVGGADPHNLDGDGDGVGCE